MPEPKAAFNRRRVLLVLGVVGLLGFGGGALANQVVARLLALPDDAEIPTYVDADVPKDAPEGAEFESPTMGDPFPSPRTRTLSEKQYSEAIVRRNIFDSSAVYDPSVAKADSVAGECKADANFRLLATVVADSPTFSSALIAVGGTRDAKAEGYAMGDDVGSEGRITLIEQKKVCLDGGSCICLGAESTKAVAAAPASGDPAAGVEKLADNKFSVESSVIEDAINNFDKLSTQVRVVPHKGSDGAIDGFRLSAIRRGSLFDKLGIKNGDIVHGVNGSPLTSTEAAMQAYQALRSERSFSFDVTRRNQRQSLEYEVK